MILKYKPKQSFLLFTTFALLAGTFTLSACALIDQLDPNIVARRAQFPVPNIIVILTDDQDYETLDFMPILQEELIGNGVNFTRAYVTTPLCRPSRASMLTGQYARNHGVLTNKLPDGRVELFEDSSTVATWLKPVGYTTSFIRKYMNGYEAISP